MDIEPNSLDDLILRGAVEVASLDEDGNFVYRMTDKAKDIVPELVDSAVSSFYDNLKTLWVLGFVTMDIADVNPVVTLSEKALDSKAVSTLDKELVMTLTFILKALKK